MTYDDAYGPMTEALSRPARIRQQHPEWSIRVVEPGTGWVAVRDGTHVWAPDLGSLGAALTDVENGRDPGASTLTWVDGEELTRDDSSR